MRTAKLSLRTLPAKLEKLLFFYYTTEMPFFRTSLMLLFLQWVVAGADLPATLPATPEKPVTDVLHGVSIVDKYRWLENQESPETRQWIGQQQSYTNAYLAALPDRPAIQQRLSELMRVDEYDLPSVRKDREFFLRHPGNQNQNQLCLRQGSTGKDEVLVDGNLLGGGHPVTVRLLDVSQDGTLVLYGLQEGGQDETTLHFLDVNTRKTSAETIPKAVYLTASLLPDRSGLYYAKKLSRGLRLFFHRMGTDPATDQLVFGERYGPETFITAQISYDGRWLIALATTGFGLKSEVYVMRLNKDRELRPVITGLDGEFAPDYYDDHLYVNTTWKAANRRIFVLDLNHPAQANWKEVLPEQKDRLENAMLVGGKLCAVYLHNAVSQAALYKLNGERERDLPLPTLGSVNIAGEADQDRMFYSFESFALPPVNYEYNVATNTQSVWWKAPAVGHFDQFLVKQVWYESKDHTSIPMFLIHRKDLKLDGSARVLLSAYGGFDISLTPSYDQLTAYWVEQGGVMAVANLRGGGEFGERWHKAGMLQNKQNVFDDFEAAAEYLERNGYTRASRLAIEGVSNGGLLVGAALVQRPDLFGAVVCSYPLLDMIRYDQFKAAQWWVTEYGSSQNKEQFAYLLQYSPYHHVQKGVKYPAVLFVTGDGDTRVDPLHARKMTALMQSSTGSAHPVLLKYDTSSGHSGGKPLDIRIRDTADLILFLNNELK